MRRLITYCYIVIIVDIAKFLYTQKNSPCTNNHSLWRLNWTSVSANDALINTKKYTRLIRIHKSPI